ncbi:hypothetical protein BGW38_001634 [Lunasporangiospora selenospora]|uniref:Uncharacterized protein n=1 Tax=Lunasporangiospora selenospora TaxID=979761 RepID=A0A9P6FTW1_9FUNG|nr:hypothetical protein BGW38_001634 [Lunasporangiospora selenospora]
MSANSDTEASDMGAAPVAQIRPFPMSIPSTAAADSDSNIASEQTASLVHDTTIPGHSERGTPRSVHSPESMTPMIPTTLVGPDSHSHNLIESQQGQTPEQQITGSTPTNPPEGYADSETRLSVSGVVAVAPPHDPAGSASGAHTDQRASTDPGPDDQTTTTRSSPRTHRHPSLSLSLGPLSNHSPLSTPFTTLPSDEPPPYSPTHTILPHYFSLEPIPIRSYIIRDSSGLPFLNDFWLVSTNQQTHSFQVQERGLSPQHNQNQLRYCIIRPSRTDRTALPASNATGPNSYFLPAMALVAANYPSRWVWWGTEALQMVVFGRQQKNIIMEWRWKHGRSRIGGPIETRLVGCSFHVTPERKYCWKQGTGQRIRNRGRGRRGGQQGRRGDDSGVNASSSNMSTHRGWLLRLRSFFSSGTTLDDVSLEPVPQIRVQNSGGVETIPPTVDDPNQSSEQVPAIDQGDANNRGVETNNISVNGREDLGDDDDDEEAGAYHCREECQSGVTGKIVAIYKPARAANRAWDRPATSCKLEIYAEVGERCETAMMLMCVRLDDLFLSIPEQKRKPFVHSTGVSDTRTGPNRDGQESGVEPSGHEAEEGAGQDNTDVVVDLSNGSDNSDDGGAGEREGGIGEAVGPSRAEGSTLRKILIGSRKNGWKDRLKWLVAVILIVVVVVLLVKPKLSKG